MVWTGVGSNTPAGLTAYDVYETTCWGIGCPTQDLYDAFMKEEGPNGYRFHESIRGYTAMQKEEGWRMKNGAVMCGDSVFMWKTRMIKDDRMGLTRNRGKNWTLMRYAEVLLVGAEAHLMNNNTAKAEEYLNMVRDRAQLPEKHGITLDDIKIEKRLELCYEGSRAQDIWRWGDGPAVLGKKGESAHWFKVVWTDDNDPSKDIKTMEYTATYPNANAFGFKAGKNERLPFPMSETIANPNIVQNPGY
jgi:hypothetical protein